MPNRFAIKVEHLRKTYDWHGKPVVVFEDVNFQVRSGEFVVVVGPTGCGKTTLLNLIAGLDRLDAGKIYVDEMLISEMSDDKLTSLRAKKIGVIFQVHNLLPALTVYENVELPLVFLKMKKDERKVRVEEMMYKAGLTPLAHRKVTTLSVGERQMVALARALAPNPDIILMDEPTEYLDPLTTDLVLAFIKSDNILKGKTTIVTTHSRKVTQMAERVIHLKKRLVEPSPIVVAQTSNVWNHARPHTVSIISK